MSNHEIRCRGCGEDLRRLGVTHEADCLADSAKQVGEILNRETLRRIAAEDKLDSLDRRAKERGFDGGIEDALAQAGTLAGEVFSLEGRLEQASKDIASFARDLAESRSRLDSALAALARFREDRERMLKRIDFASQPIGNCPHCLVGNKPGDHHLPDCPAGRQLL